MPCIFNFGWVRTAIRGLAITVLATFTTGLGIAGFAPSNAQAQQTDYLGEIVATAATFCRRGTVHANGRLMSIGSNAPLFTLYSDRYGGDGRSTFGPPDLRDTSAQRPHPQWGQVRWCVVVYNGEYPSRGNGQRYDKRIAGEVMATGANYCLSGWQMESSGALPHQKTITWCKATGSGGSVDSYLAQMLLFSGDTCPANTMAAEGQILQITRGLSELLGTNYGGDGRTTFALPNMASPAPGMKWCIVTAGYFPSRS